MRCISCMYGKFVGLDKAQTKEEIANCKVFCQHLSRHKIKYIGRIKEVSKNDMAIPYDCPLPALFSDGEKGLK